jgi:hypothetical protein
LVTRNIFPRPVHVRRGRSDRDHRHLAAGSPVFVRGYRGKTYEAIIEAFHSDAVLLLQQGYEPTGQHYVEGKWGFAIGLLATLTIPLIVGVLVWVWILTSRPIGTLTVTYVHRAG